MDHSQTIRIMPLGDSITRGKGGSSWRHHLRNRLKQEGIDIRYVGSSPHAPNLCAPWSEHYLALEQALEHNVEHEGWGGLKIHELIELAGHEFYPDFTIEELLIKNPADLILLMIGTNDIKDNHDVGNAWKRLEQLVDEILDLSEAHLLVASILPMFADPDSALSEKIKAYNIKIAGIVDELKSKGQPIWFVDMNPHLQREDMLEDGIHPNFCGDQKIAKNWFEAIAALLKEKG